MSEVMTEEAPRLDEPRTARSNPSRSKQSVHTAMSSGAGSLQKRQVEVQSFAQVYPAVQNWLHNDNPLFEFAESRMGLKVDREKTFYIVCGLLALYLIVGPGNGLLCNLIGFAYPAYQSVIAIRTEGKDDDTQWLVYWTTFASFSLLDFFAEQIYRVMPFYWLAKALFLLYLALPQTCGAHNMYVAYVDPAFDYLNANVLSRLG